MTGFLDRLLHADKPQPLDVDTAAAMLSTTPGLLREFERSYHANVLDRKNAPTGPLGCEDHDPTGRRLRPHRLGSVEPPANDPQAETETGPQP